MTERSFDASKYLTDLGGREYLEVKWRLLWLRSEHPDATVETELVRFANAMALFRAKVSIPGGGVASGWGSETANDFEDFIEKAETKALGRALAALGYGTQFCEDFDFSAGSSPKERRRAPPDGSRARTQRRRVVDTPVRRPGDLKVVRDGERQPATPAQRNALSAIDRKHRARGREGVEERCRAAFGCAPEELSRQQASQLIDLLRRPVNGSAPAQAPAASG